MSKKRRNPLIQEVKRAFFANINRGPDDTATDWIASEYEPGDPWSLVFAPVVSVTPEEEKQAITILNRLAGVETYWQKRDTAQQVIAKALHDLRWGEQTEWDDEGREHYLDVADDFLIRFEAEHGRATK